MQLGTDLDGSTLNGAHFWREFVKGTTGVLEQFVDGHLNLTAGQKVEVVDYWYPGGPYEEFEWLNLTAGTSYTLDVSSAGGHPAAYYYTGDTADFITEESAKDLKANLYYLRKPSSGYARILGADADENPIRTWPGTQIDQKPTDHLVQDSAYDNVHSWNDTWKSCS